LQIQANRCIELHAQTFNNFIIAESMVITESHLGLLILNNGIYVLYVTTVIFIYPGVTSFRRCKEQYYTLDRHMHALSKEIEHMYK